MFKKPIKADITVTHELKDEDKEYVDRKINQVKDIVKETLIFLAIGIPSVIVFGIAANIVGDLIVENTQSQD